MACDEALFRTAEEALAQKRSLPYDYTLRLYSWEPSAVSLGRLQQVFSSRWTFNPEVCARRGIDLVRRPTGGRAILHQKEVTYALIGPKPPGTVVESYCFLSQGLILAFNILGVTPEWGREGYSAKVSSPSSTPILCFTASVRSDLLVRGFKVIGSAQLRGQRAVLQQGSIPLEVDPDLHQTLFHTPPPKALPEVLGRPIPPEDLRQRVIEGYACFFGVPPEVAGMTPEEIKRAEDLLEKRYRRQEWNWRGESSF